VSLLHFTERGAGPPLLLVHGLMVTGEMFGPFLEHFAARYRVIVPDLRGHGRSRELPPPYTVPQLASDLSDLLQHLHIDSTATLGYSQGGAIAQQLALDHPYRCSRLILACTYAFNMATVREQLEGRMAPLLLKVLSMKQFARIVFSRGLSQLSTDRAEWLAGLMADQDRTLMMSAWKAAMSFDSRSRLAEIRCPTLVVAASNDRAVPLHHARMLVNGIAASRLIVVDNSDHTLIWTHEEELARIVNDFLALA